MNNIYNCQIASISAWSSLLYRLLWPVPLRVYIMASTKVKDEDAELLTLLDREGKEYDKASTFNLCKTP